MRLSTPLKTALSSAAALALLTACGGGSDDTASATSSSAPAAGSSAAPTSAELDADAAAFCADAQSALTDVGQSSTADPTAIPQVLADASAQLDAIKPPAEISDAWANFTAALDTAVSSIQGVDLSTPEGQQAFSDALTTLQGTATEDQATVEGYLTNTCGISPETAAPTS